MMSDVCWERSPLSSSSNFNPDSCCNSGFSLNQGWIYTEQIQPPAFGQTVLDYYTQRYRHSNRATWQTRIESGQIYLDGHSPSPQTCLRVGQTLTYHRPPWYEPNVPLQFEVLYEDEALWAIAKPCGLPVLPGGSFLSHTLLHQLQKHYPNETPVPIHRLGRGTSGIMLVARSPQARAHLSHQLRIHTMTKIYRALVNTEDIPEHLIIQHPIGKLPHPTLGYLYGTTQSGKPAQSECRVIARGLPSPGSRSLAAQSGICSPVTKLSQNRLSNFHQPLFNPSQPLEQRTTLLEVKILTGRPHQIRIHLAACGYPLLGDPLYQAKTVLPGAVPSNCGYWLHAHRLGFIHPITEQWTLLQCPPPVPLMVPDTH